MNVLYWPSIINYQLIPPHSVLYWPSRHYTASSSRNAQLSQLDLVIYIFVGMLIITFHIFGGMLTITYPLETLLAKLDKRPRPWQKRARASATLINFVLWKFYENRTETKTTLFLKFNAKGNWIKTFSGLSKRGSTTSSTWRFSFWKVCSTNTNTALTLTDTYICTGSVPQRKTAALVT